MTKYFSLALIFLSLMACEKKYTAQQIIDQAITKANLKQLENSTVSFTFRDKAYTAKRNFGNYTYERIFSEDSLNFKDVLSNNGFQRFVNDSLVQLTEKQIKSYGNAVNSVHYFSILPYGLNDGAVHKKLLGTTTIKGKEYFKIEVTFSQENGGDDFDDVFIYWFAVDSFKLDYLAYKYHTNGGGVRFRDVRKEHFINTNIRLVDYNNYKPLDKKIDFYTIDKLFEEGKLKKVSEINLEHIKIASN